MHCTRKPLLTVPARIMLIYKQLSRSVNYLSQSCQQSSIQPIRSWYQEVVSWNGGINGMPTGSPARSLLTRPQSVHPVRLRLHSAISNGSLFAGYCGKEQIECRLAWHWWNSTDLGLIYMIFLLIRMQKLLLVYYHHSQNRTTSRIWKILPIIIWRRVFYWELNPS